MTEVTEQEMAALSPEKLAECAAIQAKRQQVVDALRDGMTREQILAIARQVGLKRETLGYDESSIRVDKQLFLVEYGRVVGRVMRFQRDEMGVVDMVSIMRFDGAELVPNAEPWFDTVNPPNSSVAECIWAIVERKYVRFPSAN
jgi:hypothetical protein